MSVSEVQVTCAAVSSTTVLAAPASGTYYVLQSVTWQNAGLANATALLLYTGSGPTNIATFPGTPPEGTFAWPGAGQEVDGNVVCYDYDGTHSVTVSIAYQTVTAASSTPAADAIGVAGGTGADTGVAGGIQSLTAGVVALGAGLVPVLLVATLAWFVFRWLRGQS